MVGCTCGAWSSIVPPPPCPFHVVAAGPRWAQSVRTFVSCRGRHCSHDWQCHGILMNRPEVMYAHG